MSKKLTGIVYRGREYEYLTQKHSLIVIIHKVVRTQSSHYRAIGGDKWVATKLFIAPSSFETVYKL